ncbi:MAG: tail-specific protease [Flavobacteriales bacterium]|nr:MAG: tail-specific protease [Flavobacteriales bacterium]
MKIFSIIKYPVLTLGLASLVYALPTNLLKTDPPTAKELQQETIISEIVYNTLVTSHFSPPEIDKDFADRVFDEFFDNVDYTKRIFLASDIEKLSIFKKDMLSRIKSSDLSLFNDAYIVLLQRLDELPELYEAILSKPFSFDIKHDFETDDDKRGWATNEEERQKIWEDYLKYKVLSRLYESDRRQKARLEEEGGDTIKVKSFAQLEEEARNKELEFQKEWMENYRELNRLDWFAVYLNSIANLFDPHTEYYPPQQREDFEVEMSGQFEGIGAQLMTKGDYVVIDKVVTGSASWRQGDLEMGDKLLMVAEEDGEPVDVVGMSIRKVVKLIRGKKGTTVVLTVLKMDGSRKDIPIVRDVVEIEATFARGSVVEKDGKKIGYIRLPKFYVDFNRNNEISRNCADDVRVELERLKEEGVEGIILDLRNNGGGTLEGVVDIAGFFIESGPIVQVQSSGFAPRVLKDRDKNIVYDGPLLVMTNTFSASASEIFAAAIQDYQRGIIMGSRSTFGKGTVQNMADLDRMVGFRYNDFKPLGALKLTIQKFYRINGGTPQMKGVIPDIIIPDQFHYTEIGEKERPNAMEYSEIAPANYTLWKRNAKKFDKLVAESQARIDQDSAHQRIDSYARWLADQREESLVSLHFETYASKQSEYREKAESFRDIFKLSNGLTVSIPKGRLEGMEEQDVTDLEKWNKNVGEDLQIAEAVRVLLMQ